MVKPLKLTEKEKYIIRVIKAETRLTSEVREELLSLCDEKTDRHLQAMIVSVYVKLCRHGYIQVESAPLLMELFEADDTPEIRARIVEKCFGLIRDSGGYGMERLTSFQ